MSKKKPLEPEVVNESEEQDLALRQPPDALAEVSSRPAPFPFLNRFEKKRIESFTEVVKAENNLMEAITEHSRTKARLRDIDIEIEMDQMDREIKLREKQREIQLQEGKDNIAKLELEVQEDELLKKLGRGTEKPKNPLEEYKNNKEIDRQRKKVDKEFRRKENRDEIENKFATEEDLSDLEEEKLKEAEEKFCEVNKISTLREASLEQFKKWKEIEQAIKNRFYQERLKSS